MNPTERQPEEKTTTVNPVVAGPHPQTLSIPDHELVRRVGKGSYGEVWLARTVIGAFRAVKVVSRHTFDHDRPFEREFLGIQKFEPVSRTHHGLVSILHIGRSSGYFYYIMEVADDFEHGQSIDVAAYVPKTLSEIIKRRKISLDYSLHIGVLLAGALKHLHSNGLIHRDIKPSNIIFVRDIPKFADIGLVTNIGEKATFVGTEGYIPPEGPGSPSADIYGLGKVLYEISMDKDREQFPNLPTRLDDRPEAPQLLELNDILLKACDPDASDRYQSAEEMELALVQLQKRTTGRSLLYGPTGSAGVQTFVFVYNRQQENECRLLEWLQSEVEAQGFAVIKVIAPTFSVAWARELERQLAQTSAVILLLSPESLRDEMIQYAVHFVDQLAARQKGRPRLYSIQLGDLPPIPPHLASILRPAPGFRWNGPEDSQRLTESLFKAFPPGAVPPSGS